MSKIFSSKGSSSQSSSIDPQQRMMLNDAYSRMRGVADRPYQAYGGDTVADWNNWQTSADNMAMRGIDQNVGGGTLQRGIDFAGQAGQYKPLQIGAPTVSGQNIGAERVQAGQFAGTDMQPYMDPYLDTVAGGMMDKMGRQLAQTQMGNSAAATAAGAYGGSRHGVVEAETNRGFFDTLAQNLGQLYSQGFDRAAGLATGDIDRRMGASLANQDASLQAARANQSTNLQAGMANQDATLQAGTANQRAGLDANAQRLAASGALAGMSDQERNNFFANADVMRGIGDRRQAYDQANLDDQYARFQEQWNYPIQMAGMMGNFVNGMPSMGGTSSGTSRQSPSFMSSLGQGLGLAGSIMAFSDENVKSGRKGASGKKALRAIEKTPVETWRYDPAKGGPSDGEVHIGPMAQKVKKNLGLGSGRAFPVVDVMGANMAATQELAKKVRKLEAQDVKVKRIVKKGAKK